MKTKYSWILTSVSIFGLGMTVYQTINGTLKAYHILDDLEAFGSLDHEITTKEKIKAVLPCYIPAIFSALATSTCIFSTNLFHLKDKTALAGAYSLVENQYRNYVDGVKDIYGEEAHKNVVNHILAEHADNKGITAPGLIGNPSGLDFGDYEQPHLYYLKCADKFFTSTNSMIIEAEYHFNRNFTMRGSASIAELLDFFGIKMSDMERKEFSMIGWDIESGLYWVDFDHYTYKAEELEMNPQECTDGLVHIIDVVFDSEVLEQYY